MQSITIQDSRKSEDQKRWTNVLASAIFILLLVPISAAAAAERYVLRFDDLQLQGYRHKPATIFLKMALHQQYPSADLKELRLERVILVGKTKHGNGNVRLRVGNNSSQPYRVDGGPGAFWTSKRWSFDRVVMENPSRRSQGPWQIDLRGNFVVRKVVLEVRNDYHHNRWLGNYWFERRIR